MTTKFEPLNPNTGYHSLELGPGGRPFEAHEALKSAAMDGYKLAFITQST